MRRGADGLRRHALRAALALAAVCLAAPARAHGPAPAALEVLAVDDGGAPTLVRTNIGLAAANGDGTYAYVCPSRWDENERALAAASEDGREVLVHSTGVAFLSLDAGCGFGPRTDDALYVVDAARWDGAFAIATEVLESGETAVTRWDGDASASLGVEGDVDGLLGGDALYAAGHAPRAFVGRWDGAWTELFASDDETWSRVVPRAADVNGVWVLARDADAAELWRVTAAGRARGPRHDVVHGPARLADRWLAIFDGVLHAFEGGAWEALGAVDWTCLHAVGGHVYACTLPYMLELSDAPMPTGEPVFAMTQIGAPRACGDVEMARACGREWSHFGGESGWTDTQPARSPTAPRGESGCSAAPARADAPWLGWLLLSATWIRARRRRRG